MRCIVVFILTTRKFGEPWTGGPAAGSVFSAASLPTWKYLLLALGLVDPKEREPSGNPSRRAHRWLALFDFPSHVSHVPQQTPCIHPVRRLVLILPPAANTSCVQLQPKAPSGTCPALVRQVGCAAGLTLKARSFP